MMTVPLQSTPNQVVQVQLGNQSCTIAVQQTSYGLFLALYVGTAAICTSVICENLVRIVRYAYAGFQGDLVFNDTQGSSDPTYTGLGGTSARFQLVYMSASDLAAAGLSG
jgi:hypothetical protein